MAPEGAERFMKNTWAPLGHPCLRSRCRPARGCLDRSLARTIEVSCRAGRPGAAL